MITWDHLRDYQRETIQSVRESLRYNRRVILQSGTGSGKTMMGMYMLSQAVANGKRALFCVHQSELMQQTEDAFWQHGIEHGVVSPRRVRSRMPAQIAMVQTLVNRVRKGQIEPPDLIIIDEAHRSLSKTYREVVDAFPQATVIGLTATPERTDGQDMGTLYEDIVMGPPIRMLIDRGFLCDYDLYSPTIEGMDTGGFRKKGHEFDLDEVARMWEDRKVYGSAVRHYQQLTPGKRAVVACCNVAEGYKLADEYKAAGVPAACLEGKLTPTERQQLLKDFEAGKLRVLTSVNLLLEGVDIPSIEVVQWIRPTVSASVYGQFIGRGFRPFAGKERMVILDHVANFAKHGLPCEEREYSLWGESKPKRATSEKDDAGPAITSCAKCFKAYEIHLAVCPFCGELNAAKKRREMELVEMELQRIELERVAQARQEMRRAQGSARDLHQLVKLFENTGSANPASRAVHVLAGRQRRSPTPDDFREASAILKQIRHENQSRRFAV